MQPQMTNMEYMKNKARYCPYCKSDNVYPGDMDFDWENMMAIFDMECQECSNVWEDLFELKGYREKLAK